MSWQVGARFVVMFGRIPYIWSTAMRQEREQARCSIENGIKQLNKYHRNNLTTSPAYDHRTAGSLLKLMQTLKRR